MKLLDHEVRTLLGFVALLVSAWIEITIDRNKKRNIYVALLVSAWIEMIYEIEISLMGRRRTPRECVD